MQVALPLGSFEKLRGDLAIVWLGGIERGTHEINTGPVLGG